MSADRLPAGIPVSEGRLSVGVSVSGDRQSAGVSVTTGKLLAGVSVLADRFSGSLFFIGLLACMKVLSLGLLSPFLEGAISGTT